jgi:hypothetical protein
MNKIQVQAECTSCGGTGLYRGFAEPQGTAVVCLNCKGTGCITLQYTPFTKRHEKRDIQYVQRSSGSLICLGVGPTGGRITYREFAEGKMP